MWSLRNGVADEAIQQLTKHGVFASTCAKQSSAFATIAPAGSPRRAAPRESGRGGVIVIAVISRQQSDFSCDLCKQAS